MPKSSPKLTPQLLQLESRDVPATFYVDPLLSSAPDNTTQTFNAGKPNQFTGLYGAGSTTPNAKVFSSFTEAVDAAFASAGADTIVLANGDIPVDNAMGTVFLDDNLTITGSGTAVTTLKPTTDHASEQDAVLEVSPGFVLNASQFTFDGAGKMVGNGIVLSASTGLFNGVSIKNTVFDNLNGNGLFAANGSAFLFKDGSVSGYRRIGLAFQDSIGTIDNSTITGLGLYNADVPNYGVQLSGNSKVEVFASRVNDNRAVDGFGNQSFGIWLYEDAGFAPTAKITRTEFNNDTVGVVVGAAFGADASVATINFNNFFTTTSIGVEAANNTTVNAKQNYWGHPTGPSQSPLNPNGVGSSVSEDVDFRAYLRSPFQQPVPREFAVASGNQGGPVYLLAGNFALVAAFTPFNGTYKGSVAVAAGDVNGDGVNDMIVGTGAGIANRLQVADGKTGVVIRDFVPFTGGYTGGVNVASGDFNADGKSDIVVTTRAGTAPQVRIFDGATGAMLQSYLAFNSAFTNGVNVAVGDVDNNGTPDVIVGAGTGGAPQVRVFRGNDGALIQDFFAYNTAFLGGVNVAAGDINGDGRVDIITTPMFGGTHLRIFQTKLDGSAGNVVSEFFAPVASAGNGVNIAARDLDGDGFTELLFSNRAGAGSDTRFRVIFAPSVFSSTPPFLTSWASFQDATVGLNVG